MFMKNLRMIFWALLMVFAFLQVTKSCKLKQKVTHKSCSSTSYCRDLSTSKDSKYVGCMPQRESDNYVCAYFTTNDEAINPNEAACELKMDNAEDDLNNCREVFNTSRIDIGSEAFCIHSDEEVQAYKCEYMGETVMACSYGGHSC